MEVGLSPHHGYFSLTAGYIFVCGPSALKWSLHRGFLADAHLGILLNTCFLLCSHFGLITLLLFFISPTMHSREANGYGALSLFVSVPNISRAPISLISQQLGVQESISFYTHNYKEISIFSFLYFNTLVMLLFLPPHPNPQLHSPWVSRPQDCTVTYFVDGTTTHKAVKVLTVFRTHCSHTS